MLESRDHSHTKVTTSAVDAELSIVDDGLWGTKIQVPTKSLEIRNKPIETDILSLNEVIENSLLTALHELYSNYNEYRDSPNYLIQLSNLELLVGQYENAISHLSEALEHEDDSYTRELLGEAFLSNGLIKEAKQMFESVVVNDPENSTTSRLRLAEMEIRSGNVELAETLVTKALEFDRADWRTRLFEGTLKLFRDQNREAVQNFRIAMIERPRNSTILVNLAIAYLRLDAKKKAVSALRKSISLNPTDRKVLALFADLCIDQGLSTDEAKRHLERYLRLDHTDSDLISRLAQVYYEDGETTKGISLLSEFTKLFDDSTSWNNLGVLEHKRNPKKAIRHYKRAISISSQEPEKEDVYHIAVSNLVRQLNKTRQFKEAYSIADAYISEEDRASYIDNDDTFPIASIYVELCFRFGLDDRAINFAIDILEDERIHPKLQMDICSDLTTYFSLSGNVHDLEQAETFGRRGIARIDVTESDETLRKETAVNNLAYVLAEKGQTDDAMRVLNSFNTQDLNVAWATRGLIYLRRGQIKTGTRHYERAIQMTSDPDFKTVLRMKLNLELAKISLNEDDSAKARTLLKRVVKRGDPNDWKAGYLVQEAEILLSQI